jgi:hypothetical protein
VIDNLEGRTAGLPVGLGAGRVDMVAKSVVKSSDLAFDDYLRRPASSGSGTW